MNEAERIDQYLDALRRDPHAAPPPDLDAETAAFVRTLMDAERAQSVSHARQTRVWHRVLLLADPERQPPLDQKSLRRGRTQQRVTIVQPSDRHEHKEDEAMNSLQSVPLPVARPAPRTQPPTAHYFLQYTVTIAAALAVIVLLGAVLIDMLSIGEPPPLIEQTAEAPTLAVITPENVDQLQTLQILGRGTITDLAWAGNILALASDSVGLIWLYDADSPETPPRWLDGHIGGVTQIAITADGTTLASIGDDNHIRLWDVAAGVERADFGEHRLVTLAFTPDGKFLAGGTNRGNIHLWDTATGEERAALSSDERIDAITLSPDGRLLILGSGSGVLQVWDMTNSTLLATLDDHEAAITTLAFNPTGSMFASGGRDGSIRLWNWNGTTGILDVTLPDQESGISRLSFSADGLYLASALTNGAIQVWDTTTGDSLSPLAGHTQRTSGIAFSADGGTLASIGWDETLRLWDTATGVETRSVPVVRGHGVSTTAAFSPDGTLLASGGFDNRVRLWDVASGAPVEELKGHTNYVWWVAFSPDGTTLASSSHDTTIRLWDVPTGIEQEILQGHNDVVVRFAFSPDGTQLVSGGIDATLRLWDAVTGRNQAVWESEQGAVHSLAFSPDGQTLASANQFGPIPLWDVTNGVQKMLLDGHESAVFCAPISPNGTLLASCGNDATVRLWDLATGDALAVLEGHEGPVMHAAFSPDGTLLATVGGTPAPSTPTDDPTLRLWDVASRTQLAVFEEHRLGVESVNFSLDGKMIVTTSDDGTIRIWGVPATP